MKFFSIEVMSRFLSIEVMFISIFFCFSLSVLGSQIKEELNAMLLSGVKAEIEALIPSMAALCDAYLPAKIMFAEYLG